MIGQSGLLLTTNLTTSQEQASEEAQTPSDAARKDGGGGDNGFAKALLMSDPSAAQSTQSRTRQIELPAQAASGAAREVENSGKTIQRGIGDTNQGDRPSVKASLNGAMLSGKLDRPVGDMDVTLPAAKSMSTGAEIEVLAQEVASSMTRDEAGTNRPASLPPKSSLSPNFVASSGSDSPDTQYTQQNQAEAQVSALSVQDYGAEVKQELIDQGRPAPDPTQAASSPGPVSSTPGRLAAGGEEANLRSGARADLTGAPKSFVQPDIHASGDVPADQREPQLEGGAALRERLEAAATATRSEKTLEEVQSAATGNLPSGVANPSDAADLDVAEKLEILAVEAGPQSLALDPIWAPASLREVGQAGNVAPDATNGAGVTVPSETSARLSAVERIRSDGPPLANDPESAPEKMQELAPLKQDMRPEQALSATATAIGGQRSSLGSAGAPPSSEPPLPTPQLSPVSGASAEGSPSPATVVAQPAQMGAVTAASLKKLSLDDPLDIRAGLAGVSGTGSVRTEAPAAPLPSVAADPRVVIQQITQALIRMDGARTEVTLDPVELGRVSLTFVTKDDGVSVSVVADRPETADLLRRNSEQLQRDLTDAGYEGVELDFDEQDSDQGSRQKGDAADAAKTTQSQPVSYRVTHTDAGLDIRI